jgi:hypothetical protein
MAVFNTQLFVGVFVYDANASEGKMTQYFILYLKGFV